MKLSARAVFWIALYLFMIFAPLLIILVGPRPAGREFWREFAVALGFIGLSLMGLQFIPTARLPFLCCVFPMDTMYFLHHAISVASLGFVLAHPLILLLNNPYIIQFFNPATSPWRALSGVLATLAAFLLVTSSVFRKSWRIIYEPWRLTHGLLSVITLVLALIHIFQVNYYTAMPLQRLLWIVLPVLWLALVVYARGIKPALMLKKPYELKEVRKERCDSWTLALAPVGHPGIEFKPGQFAWLAVQRSPFDIRQHPFSFSSSAERKGWLEFTIKELGNFTRTVKDVPTGARLYVDGPYGTFGPDFYDAPGYVLLAGGVGVTPIMSMLRTLADRGDRRPLVLFYGSPTWEDVIYREEIEELEKRLNLKVVHVLERPHEGWQGEKGFINTDILNRHLPAERADLQYFMCGPLPMIQNVEPALQRAGVPLERAHSERYEMA
ncbi:MAG: oxidoreductase [Chloroflexi bacterium]|nr:oxidoreductase [Chloroflexota bacterium]